MLNKEVEHLRNKQSSTNTEMTSKGFGGLNETLDLINAKNNIGNDGQAYKGNLSSIILKFSNRSIENFLHNIKFWH